MRSLMHQDKKLEKPTLLDLTLECSSLCNFNCKMCPRPKENGTMPIGDIKRIIEEFADQGGETIKPFWRGEPMLDERMVEILKYAKKCSLKTMINSNASDPHSMLEACLPYIDWISFSIDEQHNNIEILTYQRLLNAATYKDMYVEVQASQHNIIVMTSLKWLNIPYKVDPPTKRSDTDNESEVITGERKYCGFPDWRLVVAWNGDCTMCCVDWQLENKVGNVYDNSLTDIFDGIKSIKLRNILKSGYLLDMSDICDFCPSRSAYVN